MNNLIKQIEELNLRCDSSTLLPVILQVEQLIKERDEARRMYCEERSCPTRKYFGPLVSKHSIAGNNMWDCFKEKEETQ